LFALTFSSPFSSLVSSESGGQKCGLGQDLYNLAELIYRTYECFEPVTLFLPQGSFFFPPLPLLSILKGCEVPDDATAYVLPHHPAADFPAACVVEATSFSLFPSHIDSAITKAVQLAGGNTTLDETDRPPIFAVGTY
jgi:hypothetical protein